MSHPTIGLELVGPCFAIAEKYNVNYPLDHKALVRLGRRTESEH